MLAYDFRFTLGASRTLEEVCERLLPPGGLAGCDIGHVPTPLRHGSWLVTVYSRQPADVSEWGADILAIFKGQFPEARYEGQDIDQTAEAGIQWVTLNGPQDGLGNRLCFDVSLPSTPVSP